MAVEDEKAGAQSLYFHQAAAPSDAGASGMPQPGHVIAGKYRIEGLIGQGGMGAVYRATHVMMDKAVAVKWLVPDLHEKADARERFVREARAAARIRHPNVVDVYDVGEQGGALYMVMELLVGDAFDDVLARGDLSIANAITLLSQAMWGVQAAHDQGIIHRDIKPENLFVVDDPTQPSGRNCKVLDFGISKLTEDSSRNHGLTQTGAVMGTPAYMSLEQMKGSRHVDARADVYAFGVLLYQALTGQMPFDGETYGAIAVAVATHTPEPPEVLRPELPPGLNAVVLRALARQREDRYPSVRALIDALSSLPEVEGYVGRTTQPALRPTRTHASVSRGAGTGVPVGTLASIARGRRSRSAWVAVLCFGLVGVALAVASALVGGLSGQEVAEAVDEGLAPSPAAPPRLEEPAEVATESGARGAAASEDEGDGQAAPVALQMGQGMPATGRAPAATSEVDAPDEAEALSEPPMRKPPPRRRHRRKRREARVQAAPPAAPAPAAELPPATESPPEAPTAQKEPSRPSHVHRSGGISLDELIGAP